jgi:tetratricopeptide (TPR) repeat protein
MDESNLGRESTFKRRLKHFMWTTRLHKRVTAAVVVVLVLLIAWLVYALFSDGTTDAPANKSTNPAVLQYQKQLPDLKKAAEDKPKDANAQSNYAVALYATGSTKDAETYYKKAIALKPNDATLYNNLGNAQRDLKDYHAAVGSYKKSISLNDKLMNPYVNLANLEIYTLNKPADGIDTYQQALKALPGNAQVQILLGLAYEKQGNTAQAKKIYQSVLDQDPNNAAAKSNLERLNN